MFLERKTRPSTGRSSAELQRLKRELETADAILIGAGSGLSTAAGFEYDGARFRDHFADFEARYGFHDMYSGGFYPYPTPEEHWAYWSRYIYLNRYLDAPEPVYDALLALVRSRDYFVLTTNVDHCFQKAGFDKGRLFYTQGDYGLFQCSGPCCQETWDNEDIIRQMVAQQRELQVPGELIPRCPHCGKPMTMNLRSDERFVQDEGWYRAAERYQAFVRRHQSGHVLYLELGVGYNTPAIIKYSFWRMTAQNPQAVYACLNRGEALAPAALRGRAILFDGDIAPLLRRVGAA